MGKQVILTVENETFLAFIAGIKFGCKKRKML